jgi:hypothetical protein
MIWLDLNKCTKADAPLRYSGFNLLVILQNTCLMPKKIC